MSGIGKSSAADELGQIPYVLPHPGTDLFTKRAERMHALSQGCYLGDFLSFCARLAAAQAKASTTLAFPDDEQGLIPLRSIDVSSQFGDAWMEALRTIAAELGSSPMPAPARGALTRIVELPREDLIVLARKTLSGDFVGLDLAVAPFVAAALQVYFAAGAARIPTSKVESSACGCPLCGWPPVAAIVLGNEKLRYLACGLCGSAWYLPRVKCSHCGSTAGISYFSLEGDPGGVKVEVCEACKRYLKLFYLERRPAAEPVADDLATYPLDLLVSEKGYRRSGINLFLFS